MNIHKYIVWLAFVVVTGCGSSQPQPDNMIHRVVKKENADSDQAQPRPVSITTPQDYEARYEAVCSRLEEYPGDDVASLLTDSDKGSKEAELPIGTIPRGVLQSVINKGMKNVRRCYDDALVIWPQLSGRVTVFFIIDPFGKVQFASIKQNGLDNKHVGCCIADAITKLEFPKPDGDGWVMITYPLIFSPSQ